MKIEWINKKDINFELFQNHLQESLTSNQLTNYGPAVQALEKFLAHILQIDEDRCLIVTDNGTSALHALVAGINLYLNRRIYYATQAFTFPSSCQGPLQDALIVDIDSEMGLDLQHIPANVEGIIVTNLFGHVVDIHKYQRWAEDNQKILLFDNATVPMTFYDGKNAINYGDGCIVSLHHTKPLGFGEADFIEAKKEGGSYTRHTINFSFHISKYRIGWSRQASNYKMSDITTAAHLIYLQVNRGRIIRHRR
jgi:dTDP-4-amino-4,6-dideoxygalactose transaminase